MKDLATRRSEAFSRLAGRKSISDADQLKHLDAKFGAGMGAQRERLRLKARISAALAAAKAPKAKPQGK